MFIFHIYIYLNRSDANIYICTFFGKTTLINELVVLLQLKFFSKSISHSFS